MSAMAKMFSINVLHSICNYALLESRMDGALQHCMLVELSGARLLARSFPIAAQRLHGGLQ